ncbi:MAG TPA: hypothetical protein VH497_08705 [Vicinamibacterales bacterium]|jgi:hypothetical protein
MPDGLLEMTTVTTTTSSRVSLRKRTKKQFYVGLTLFMVAIVLIGFWPSYFGPLLRGRADRPPIIQLHGVVFVGWMALLVVQVILAARGNIRRHRIVGNWGIAYGCLVLTMGLVASFAAPIIHLRAGEWDRDRAAAFLLTPLGDMVLFGSFFGAAVAFRSRPEIHKRMMVAATVALLFAAVGRMEYLPIPVLMAIWLSPMAAGIVHDWATRRSVHPAYIVATVVLAIAALRIFVDRTPAWLAISRPVIDALR